MGSSHELGAGVEDGETFESLVEDRLNRSLEDANPVRFEILNMAVGGDSPLQKLLRLEESGFAFQPDAVLFCLNEFEPGFIVMHLRDALAKGIAPPPEYRFVEDIVGRAGLDRRMSEVMVMRRLRPHYAEIYRWVFDRLAQECAAHDVRPFLLFRPDPEGVGGEDAPVRRELIRHAEAAGIEVIDLSPAFEHVADRKTLILAEWDNHTTPLGHRLLADTLYEALVPLVLPAPPDA
jgi:hypothetical protein